MRKHYKLYKVVEKRQGFFCLEFVHTVQALDIVEAEGGFRASGCMEEHGEYLIVIVG